MRHGHGHRSLGRKTAHRHAMLKNLAVSLILHEKIETTDGKAKELRKFVEPLITTAKSNTVPNVRRLSGTLPEQGAVKKLFAELGPKYKNRPGGYVRLTKLGPRSSDGAERTHVELV
jgi:large subunit ribosomal protein L17